MRSQRRGYSLIETLVVIVLTGTTLTVAAVTMHALHRAQHRLRDAMQSRRAVDQLAFQLRQDAHAAASAKLGVASENRSQSVTLEGANGHDVEYSPARKGIDRVARRGGIDVHRETFHVSSPDQCFWAIDASRGRSVLVLHLPHSAGGSQFTSNKQVVPTIRAVVNRTRHSSRGLPSPSP